MEKRLATEGDDDNVYDSFNAMNLKKDLLRGIYEYGYKKPSVVQQRVIVPLSKGDDLVLQEMLGPGRTSAYCIGILQQLEFNLHECQCLILAFGNLQIIEIAAAMRKLGQFMGVKVNARLRSVDFTVDDDLSTDPYHVVVGMAEHVLELLRRKIICPKEIKMLVLDEATTMMKFDRQRLEVYEIIKYLKNKRGNRVQISAFSETMPTLTLDRITQNMRKNPVVILAQNGHELSLDGINQHRFLNLRKEDVLVKKLEEFIDKTREIAPIMVFVSNHVKLNSLATKLEADGCTFSVVRGCMDQKERDEMKKDFLQQKRVILATTLWSRGIIEECGDEVRFIVNCDNSPCVGNYIRQLCWFRRVIAAISFANSDDWYNLVFLQEDFNIAFGSLQPSQYCAEFWREETVEVSTIKEAPSEHFIIDCGDEDGKVDVLLPNIPLSLYGKFDIARLSVIFVNSLNRIPWLAEKLKVDSKYEVLTPEDKLIVHPILPTIFITTDNKFYDGKVKAHLVINFDVPLALENYNRRRRWCQSNGIFLLLVTDVDWYEVLDKQALYNVIFTQVPPGLDDILEKMVATKISPSTSKRPQTRKRPRAKTQRLLIS